MKNLRIVFVSHDSLLYGAERSLLDFVSHAPQFITPLLVVPRPGLLTGRLDELNIRYKTLGHIPWTGVRLLALRRVFSSIVNYRASLRLRRLVGDFKADLIYSNSIATSLGAAVAHAAGIPHLWHIREFAGPRESANFSSPFQKSIDFINRTTDYVIYNSCAVAQHYSKSGVSVNSSVVYNGIECDCELNIDSRKRSTTFLVAGSINKHKNQQEAIEALGMLCEKNNKARLIIAGIGNRGIMRFLSELVNRLGLDDRVVFSGYVQNLKELYKDSCALVMCSKREPWGRVLVEAMACGCPVIAASEGGAPEIIEHERTGLLYPSGDAAACASLMARVADGGPNISLMTRNALSCVKNRFSPERYCGEVSAAIASCIENRRTESSL
jgi:glycosyltransferase involved in cell wall biosynthesis